MKISDIPGDRAIDVLADCIDPFVNIAQDKDLTKELQEIDTKGTVGQLKGVSVILKKHQEDMYAILAAIAGEPVKQYLAKRNALQVLKDAMDVMTDDDLLGFMPAAQSDTGSRGDASANTEAAPQK